MRERVADLWPQGLIRARSGRLNAEVEVARPANVAEVVNLLRGSRRVVVAGGRSGVCGALTPEPDDLVVDMTGFTAIEVDEFNLTVRAQAGVNGLELERALNQQGLTLGHFPSSLPSATVGGLLSTRSSGQESTRHGSVEDMVIGVTVALPDGRLIAARPQPRSATPALHQLFLGAEGALGVIVEAVLRVRRLPEKVIGQGWRLPGLVAGWELTREAMQSDLQPLVLRLYDPEDSRFQGLEEGCLLVGAVAGPEAMADAEAKVLSELAQASGAMPLGEAPWNRWLRHRFDLSATRLRELLEPPGSYLDTIELASWWSSLPSLYAEVKAHLARFGLALCHFSHPYPQGCCAYFTFVGSSADDEAAEAAYREAWQGTMEIALRHGAGITHHHGVGRLRAPWVQTEMGDWWQVWELIRAALDPQRQMNAQALGGNGRE